MLAVLNSAPASPVARLPAKVEPQTITSVSSDPSIKIAPPLPPAPHCPGPLTPGQLAASVGPEFGLTPLAALPVNSLLWARRLLCFLPMAPASEAALP